MAGFADNILDAVIRDLTRADTTAEDRTRTIPICTESARRATTAFLLDFDAARTPRGAGEGGAGEDQA